MHTNQLLLYPSVNSNADNSDAQKFYCMFYSCFFHNASLWEKSFRAPVCHMMDTIAVVTRFSHYVKLALKPSSPSWGAWLQHVKLYIIFEGETTMSYFQ